MCRSQFLTPPSPVAYPPMSALHNLVGHNYAEKQTKNGKSEGFAIITNLAEHADLGHVDGPLTSAQYSFLTFLGRFFFSFSSVSCISYPLLFFPIFLQAPH